MRGALGLLLIAGGGFLAVMIILGKFPAQTIGSGTQETLIKGGSRS